MKKLLLSLLVATGLALPIHAAEIEIPVTAATVTKDGITMTFSGSPTISTNHIRMLASTSVTFTSTVGNIEQIYIESEKAGSNNNYTVNNKLSCSQTGVSIAYGTNGTSPNATITSINSEKVVLNNKGNNQIRITKVVVKTADGGDVPPTPEVIATPEISPADGSTLYPGDNVTITCATADAKIIYTVNNGEEIEYSAPIEFDTDGTYVVKAYATNGDNSVKSEVASATFTYSSERPAEPETLTDELTIEAFGSPSSYSNKTYTSPVTDITYAANLTTNNGSMQIRSTNSNSGIVTTANPNGYILKSYSVTWSSSTASGRELSVYTQSANYKAASDLYNNLTAYATHTYNTAGATNSVKEDEAFTAVGFRSKSGAQYISKITIVWEKGAADTRDEAGLALTNAEVAYDLNDEFTAQTLTNPNGLAVKWISSNTSVATIDAETGAINVLAIGSTTITATFDGNETYLPAEVSYTLTVSDRTLIVHTFDFINNDYGMIRHTSGTEYNPTPYSFGDGWVAVNANGQNRLWSTKGLRLYKNATITVCATECETATIVSARFLNADGSVDTNRNHQFTIEGNKATFTLSSSDNADFPKIEICYKDITEEEIIAAFEASEKFTVTANSNVIANGSNVHKDETADVVVSIAHHYPHATIYYKWEADPEEPGKGEENEENAIETYASEGYQAHTQEIKLPSAGTLSYYAELNGKQTPVHQITVTGTTTSISDVNVAEGGADEWFDLQGRRVAKAVNGVFIHRIGGKAVKVCK